MSTVTRPWLPPNALLDETLSNAVCACAKAWTERWFSDPKTVSTRLNVHTGVATPSKDSACYAAGPDLWVSMEPMSQIIVASWMLGVTTGAQKLSEPDRTLFRQLAAECAGDFLRRIAGLFVTSPNVRRISPTSTAQSGLRFSMAIGSVTQALQLYVGETLAVAARRAAVAVTPIPAPLGQRANALDRQSVRVGAKVGTAKLGLGDLYALSGGDILVLDRARDQDFVLTVAGQPASGAACMLVQHGDAMQLRITRLDRSHQP